MIYLDNASTTALDPRVLETMMPYFLDCFQNASSNNKSGKLIKSKIEESRQYCADLINAHADEIIFTSGATEAINYALKGFLEENFEKGNHIITCKTEHKAVLKTCEYLETKGVEVTYLNVDKSGALDFKELERVITPQTSLIAIMLVNNETGVIHDLKAITEIAHSKNVVVFCDATQAIGKISVNVKDLKVDMLCMSGHKINGPKGIGYLYIKKGISLTPLIHGGSQENDNRGGTYNAPLIIGLGKACEILNKSLVTYQQQYSGLSKYFTDQIEKIEKIDIISTNSPKVSNIINLRIKGIDANVFVESNREISLSNGSACTSRIIEGSHVLKAMGLSDAEANECIRISFDKNTTKEEVEVLIKQLRSI